MFENVDGRTTDGGRTTDTGVTCIIIAHLRAFGSGELKTVLWFRYNHAYMRCLLVRLEAKILASACYVRVGCIGSGETAHFCTLFRVFATHEQ